MFEETTKHSTTVIVSTDKFLCKQGKRRKRLKNPAKEENSQIPKH